MSDRHIPAELRRLVAERARQCCEYCCTQEQYSADSFTVDHILPRSLSGPTTAENLALCCQGCNQHKATRIIAPEPITGSPSSFFHPRQHREGSHHPGLKHRAQVAKGAGAPWEPGLPGLVIKP